MRCFIAVELPEEVKNKLGRLQEELKKKGADIRWVTPDNIHLTLKFFGEVREEKVLKITEAVESICSNFSAFNFMIKGLGVFPNSHSPRVLWVGIEDNNTLETLQAVVEEKMWKIGFKREDRVFRAHLTIGRFRPAYSTSRRPTGRSSLGTKEILDAIERHKNDSFGDVDVRSLALIRSDLHLTGARHTRIREFTLKK